MISVLISLNILVTHVTKSIVFFLRQTIITIGTGIFATIFGIEIVMIKKNFSFP